MNHVESLARLGAAPCRLLTVLQHRPSSITPAQQALSDSCLVPDTVPQKTVMLYGLQSNVQDRTNLEVQP